MAREIVATATCDRCAQWLKVEGRLATQDWRPEGWGSFPRPDSFGNWDLCPGCYAVYGKAIDAAKTAFFAALTNNEGGTQ